MISCDEIKDIEVTSSDDSIATVDTFASFGKRFSIKPTGNNDGLITVDVYAFNDEAEQSASMQESFYLLNPFNVIDVTGTGSNITTSHDASSGYSRIIINSDLLESVSIKVKDEFKDRFSIEVKDYNDTDSVEVTEEDGVYTFNNIVIPNSETLTWYIQLNFDNEKFMIVYLNFCVNSDKNYAIDDSDAYLDVYNMPDVEDGQTVNLSLSKDHLNGCYIEIDPVILTKSNSITWSCVSSDTSVLNIGEMVYLYLGESFSTPTSVKFPITLLSVGEAVITANVSDNFGYSKTYTFTVIVSE